MTILTTLRLATRDAHDAVEGVVGLTGSSIDLQTYRAHLARLYGLYAPIEAALAQSSSAWAGHAPAAVRCRKLTLLASDLAALGVEVRWLPRCESIPQVGTAPRALGCLYVLEGSTLGGQVILRLVRAALGDAVHDATAFLTSYGPALGATWKAFGEGLERYARARGGEDDQAIVASACATFAAFRRWLDPLEACA